MSGPKYTSADYDTVMALGSQGLANAGIAAATGMSRQTVTRMRAGQWSPPGRRTHGLAHHPLYDTHKSMMGRCYWPTAEHYEDYGGRGIEVCDEWHDIAVFTVWIEANLGPRPDGMTLDRIRNDGNYAL